MSGEEQTGEGPGLTWVKTAPMEDQRMSRHLDVELEHSADGRFSITRCPQGYGATNYRLDDSHFHTTKWFGLVRQAEEHAAAVLRHGHPPIPGAEDDDGHLDWEHSASRWERLRAFAVDVEIARSAGGRFTVTRQRSTDHNVGTQYIVHDNKTHRTSEKLDSLHQAKRWAEGSVSER